MVISLKRVSVWFMLCLVSICILHGGAISVWNENTEKGVLLPILMYHHVLKDSASWGKFVISPDELEQDLQYLKENGFHSVSAEELIRYTKGEGDLPANPVMLTVDDGCLSSKEYIAPLLEKYQMKAILSVVGAYSDEYTKNVDRNVSYAYLTWEDISNLSDSGVFEIGNHTYDMHKSAGGRKGSMIKAGESAQQYRKALEEDLLKTQQKIEESTGNKSICFTYPYGFISKESIEPIKEMEFEMSLSCNEGLNIISRDPECLYTLNRYNRPHGKSAQEIIDGALRSFEKRKK